MSNNNYNKNLTDKKNKTQNNKTKKENTNEIITSSKKTSDKVKNSNNTNTNKVNSTNNKKKIDYNESITSEIPLKENATTNNKKKIDYNENITSEIPLKENTIKTVVVKKKKRKLKTWVWIVIATFFLSTLLISIMEIAFWGKDNHKTKEIINEVVNDTSVEEVEDNEKTENVNEPEDETSDYWYYISFPLINVNFDELIKKNSDTISWINVNNTNINYPIVHTDNNDFYLNHSYDKTYNEAGWVFLDYRNNSSLSDRNNIIYAHSRLDKTMFGSLSKALNQAWYTNKDNHIIRLSTPTENTLWQIFSVYVIPEESYYITINFTDDAFLEFLNTVKGRSRYNFNTELNVNDKILTLSTCYSDTERTVVHAKLIKRESRF